MRLTRHLELARSRGTGMYTLRVGDRHALIAHFCAIRLDSSRRHAQTTRGESSGPGYLRRSRAIALSLGRLFVFARLAW